jgi:hypothetical protein
MNAELAQHALVGSLGYRFGDSTTLQWSLGALLEGDMEAADIHYDVRPGFLTSFALSHGWLKDRKTFLVTSLSAGVSTTTTESGTGGSARLTAIDVRGSLMLGYTFAKIASPYVFVRGFGGPVYWALPGDTLRGSDRNHYAFGAGIVMRADAFRFSLSGSALGERSVSAGVSYHY